MAIKNLPPRLAERGKIKIGVKGELRKGQGGKEYRLPQKLDHIILTTLRRDEAGRLMEDKALMAKYADQDGKVRELPIYLLFDDPELNFITRYLAYDVQKVYCTGDGEQATRYEADGEKIMGCPCPLLDQGHKGPIKCKPSGLLQVVLKDMDRVGGVWTFRTTSWNSVTGIMSSLRLIWMATGGVLAGLPLWLVLSPKTVTIPGTGGNQTVFVMSCEYRGTMEELAEKGQELMSRQVEHKIMMKSLEARARLALEHFEESPAEILEVVEEFYPEQAAKVHELAGGAGEKKEGEGFNKTVTPTMDKAPPDTPPANKGGRPKGVKNKPKVQPPEFSIGFTLAEFHHLCMISPTWNPTPPVPLYLDSQEGAAVSLEVVSFARTDKLVKFRVKRVPGEAGGIEGVKYFVDRKALCVVNEDGEVEITLFTSQPAPVDDPLEGATVLETGGNSPPDDGCPWPAGTQPGDVLIGGVVEISPDGEILQVCRQCGYKFLEGTAACPNCEMTQDGGPPEAAKTGALPKPNGAKPSLF